jgi:hypothetical protein
LEENDIDPGLLRQSGWAKSRGPCFLKMLEKFNINGDTDGGGLSRL